MDVVAHKDLDRVQQTRICRAIVEVGRLLMQHGAESKLIEETTCRLGLTLGLQWVDMAITTNAIVLTGRFQGRCVTTTRRVYDKGLNMHMICEVQHLTILAERGLLDLEAIVQRIQALEPIKYNRYLVAFMVGLSCASFCVQFGGGLWAFIMTFIASSLAMLVRQSLGAKHFNPMINFFVSAFVATTVASVAVYCQWVDHPEAVLASSVLLLIPGFPLMNAVSDLVKGHVQMGISRGFFASLLTFAAAGGISLAMWFTGIVSAL